MTPFSIAGRTSLLTLALTFGAPAFSADPALLSALATPGHVLLLRHAHAPGVGDPAHFRVGDCATQRNLDERGRKEARAVGAALRAGGIARATVYSSEWCRCTETAALLGLGPVHTRSALNSFFSRPGERPARLAATRMLLAESEKSGTPVVMVTHDVTIAGITGHHLRTGEGVVLRVVRGEPHVLGTLRLATD